MKKYLGVKTIEAEPMTADDYNKYIKEKSSERNHYYSGEDRRGYLVKYEDGYESWSPKDVFEKAYRLMSNMNFGQAMEEIKQGKKVDRNGWNGKGMVLQAQFPDEHSKMTHPYLYMTIPDCTEGTRKLPWQPAQVDLFSEDWNVVD